MADPDPRLTPARADLAAKFLEGKVRAERFVEGRLLEVIAPHAPLRQKPSPDAPLDTQALRGDRFAVYDDNGEGWCWGQLQSDGYVGWVPSAALAAAGDVPTHRVSALRTFVFPGPSIKLPPVEALPFGSRVRIAASDGAFAVTDSGGFMPARHVRPANEPEHDFVAVAERFAGVPYLWGGRTADGIDCSGLVQVSLVATGLRCLRDSDMQETTIGRPLAHGEDAANVRRGDLMFWPGHVAIVCAPGKIIHANAFHMEVAVEPLDEALARIAATGSAVRTVRRIE